MQIPDSFDKKRVSDPKPETLPKDGGDLLSHLPRSANAELKQGQWYCATKKKRVSDPKPETLPKDGGDLLSHLRSTIGVNGLNFSVRNGKRWNPAAIAT